MKKLFIAALLAFGIGTAAQAQNVAINTDGSAADNSAILDVKAPIRGANITVNLYVFRIVEKTVCLDFFSNLQSDKNF